MVAKHLRVLDEHGEVHEQCPGCESKQYAFDQLVKKYQGALSVIGKLEADRDEEARNHEAWPDAVRLFEYWKLQTGHKRAPWKPERFWVLLPQLRHYGVKNCAAAIAGIAYEPNRKLLKSGRWEVYDDWETCFGSVDKCKRYILRRPRGWVLPEQFENDIGPPG